MDLIKNTFKCVFLKYDITFICGGNTFITIFF